MENFKSKNKILLENIRDNPLASIQFQLSRSGNSSPRYIRSGYMDYVRKAFNDMVHGLQSMENATNTSAFCSVDYVNSASLWFLAIELFISDVLEIFYYFNPSERPTAQKHEKITAKIQRLIRIARFAKKECRQTKYFARIEEFANIRNSIFHGAYPREKASINNTIFYDDMMQWNIVDCLQAYKIAVETFHLFDLIIPQFRLMPQIPFAAKDAATWIFLDDLHKEYLIPYFNAVLKKHDLDTKLDLTIFKNQYIDSSVIPAGGVKAIIYARSSSAFDLANVNTTLNSQCCQALKKYLPAPDMIKLPNMNRQRE